MGICNPVNLSNAEIVVKNEPSGDLLLAVGGRSPSSATASSASSPSGSGEFEKLKLKLIHSIAKSVENDTSEHVCVLVFASNNRIWL